MILLLGRFDAECNLIDVNDDAFDLNSRLMFAVPDSGVFILAATSFPDFEFAGSSLGDYRMTIAALSCPLDPSVDGLSTP